MQQENKKYHITLTNILVKNYTIEALNEEEAIKEVQDFIDNVLEIDDYDGKSGWQITYIYNK